MSEIERFDVSSCGNRSCDPLLIEDDGVYVYYDEYAKLKAENESLRELLSRARGYMEPHDPLRNLINATLISSPENH